jgi:hypothetical protein
VAARMSDRMHTFEGNGGATVVALPFDLDACIADWTAIRTRMVRERVDAFTRDEWAYLITFLEPENLLRAFRMTFGERNTDLAPPARLARPRGKVIVWLPNNVSLLGPLSMILLSLTGNEILLKEGSRAEPLTSAFLQFADNVKRVQVIEDVSATSDADVVIVFGSDAAIAAAAPLVKPGATLIPFGDRRSEAWLVAEAATDEVLVDLVKVFAVYGQAGCTSPSRVVVLDGSASEMRDRIVALWPQRLRNREPHVASANVLARQLAAAAGWDAKTVAANSAVIASGTNALTVPDAGLILPIVALSVDEAIASLPDNIQTIGHNVDSATAIGWLASTPVKRIVPIAAMHHFGSVWDGRDWWSECFEWVEVGA